MLEAEKLSLRSVSFNIIIIVLTENSDFLFNKEQKKALTFTKSQIYFIIIFFKSKFHS